MHTTLSIQPLRATATRSVLGTAAAVACLCVVGCDLFPNAKDPNETNVGIATPTRDSDRVGAWSPGNLSDEASLRERK
jgi:hypothetical protein